MTQIVSVADFRNDISKYLSLISKGDVVIIKDNKKNIEIAQVTGTKTWNPEAYRAMLKRMVANPISAKDHPEWATRSKLEKWLRSSRLADERNFNVRP